MLDNFNSFGDEKIGERKKGEGGRKYGIYCENRHILYQKLNHSIMPLLIFSERSKSVYTTKCRKKCNNFLSKTKVLFYSS